VNNDISVSLPYVYTTTDLMFILGWIVVGFIVLGIAFWYENREPKVKPRVAICVKCRFCVMTTGVMSKGKETKYRCRLPNDMKHTDFITGKIEYPKYSCRDRNACGACPHYQRKQWL